MERRRVEVILHVYREDALGDEVLNAADADVFLRDCLMN